MKITDVRVRCIEGQNRLKAIASITIEGVFAVHELRIIEGNNGLFVAMPSRQSNDGVFRDIAHPINSETREQIQKLILEKYQETVVTEE